MDEKSANNTLTSTTLQAQSQPLTKNPSSHPYSKLLAILIFIALYVPLAEILGTVLIPVAFIIKIYQIYAVCLHAVTILCDFLISIWLAKMFQKSKRGRVIIIILTAIGLVVSFLIFGLLQAFRYG